MQEATYWIEKLGLTAHPEGGYFRETYRATECIATDALPERFPGARSFSTAIYFLLRQSEISTFHRIRSDEIWFWHAGGALTIFMIAPDGALTEQRLGANPENNELFQVVVPAGAWFAARPDADTEFVLVSCTVAPGFDFTDFEMVTRTKLTAQFPQHGNVIAALTLK
ncbi:TPA: hypothetical protein DDW35_03835 [Candidatus Sumerlaeota bacterium]|jgi:uncharacterized protein|nr:hypothetical protein [Candidatus Sumerlaeota bacterium]